MEPEPSSSPDFSPLDVGEDIPLPEYKAAGTASLDFAGLLDRPLRLHEDPSSGCGGQTWPAGTVLARHMLRYQRGNLRHARILEIGAGSGLVGLAVALGCRLDETLYVTDQKEMLSLMEYNVALNELDGRVRPRVLDWGETLTQEMIDFKPNVILAADCVYFEPAFPLLLGTLTDLLGLCPDATIFFCFKKRRRADMQFLKKARKTFHVADVDDDERPVFGREGIFLHTLNSRARKQPEGY